jgi:hypothetical protein
MKQHVIHKIFRLSALLSLTAIMSGCQKQAEVLLCGTMHAYHKQNPNYTYEDLFDLIEAFDPDIIGVEIRPEDMQCPDSVLNCYYPYEMIEVLKRYGDRKICGIDWWSESAEGQVVTSDLLNALPQLKIESALASDTAVMNIKPAVMDSIDKLKTQLLTSASMQKMMTGPYDSLNLRYYELLESYLQQTPYSRLHEVYMLRHYKIGSNMAEVVKQNPGKRIVFLTGADHRVFARNKLLKECGGKLHLLSDIP